MRSLQTRLSTGLIVSLIILFSLQWWIVSRSIRSLTEGYIESRLRHDSEGLLAAINPAKESAPLTLNQEHLDLIYNRPFSGHYYMIRTGDHLLHSRSLWDYDLPVPDVSVGETRRLYSPGPGGQNLLLLVNGFKKQDRPVIIAVAEDLSEIETDIRHFQFIYGAVSLAILVVLIIIQRLIIGIGLAPLKEVRRDITSLEKGEIGHLREEVPGEIRPLIKEINHLLETMTERLQRSRKALGNLAHALKAPLTLLTQLSDREEIRNYPEIRHHLSEYTGTLRSLLERELRRVRLAGTPRPGQQIVLETEIRHLLDALKKIYKDKALEMTYSIPPGGILSGDREDMLELLGNLLDNACKWAQGKVALTVEKDDGIFFCVEDDGPGCPDEELDRLSQRGVRIDESATGHGLGLAIVRDIVEQYSGEVVFGHSEHLGGFKVFVRLPIPHLGVTPV
jgi:signal transduction histidine kinase